MMNKREIRKELKERLSSFSNVEKERADRAIFDRLLAMKEYREASSLFIYYSTADEVDTRAIVREALAAGKTLYLPRIEGEEMALVRYGGESLSINPYGILEPTGAPSDVVPDLAVIPLLGFDRKKHRLGRGKGYYDRFLEKYEGTSLALAYAKQEWDSLPAEDHDRAPEAILTEKEIIR